MLTASAPLWVVAIAVALGFVVGLVLAVLLVAMFFRGAFQDLDNYLWRMTGLLREAEERRQSQTAGDHE